MIESDGHKNPYNFGDKSDSLESIACQAASFAETGVGARGPQNDNRDLFAAGIFQNSGQTIIGFDDIPGLPCLNLVFGKYHAIGIDQVDFLFAVNQIKIVFLETGYSGQLGIFGRSDQHQSGNVGCGGAIMFIKAGRFIHDGIFQAAGQRQIIHVTGEIFIAAGDAACQSARGTVVGLKHGGVEQIPGFGHVARPK